MISVDPALEAAFTAAFGRAPAATGAVPGRVNLIGEHIDYNGGTVLPAALDRHVRVGLAVNAEPHFTIRSTRFDAVAERAAGMPKQGSWADYAAGALEKARALGWLAGGAALLIDSDVPDGAGVSTSAALITAILRASAKIAGTGAEADPVAIAQHARAVENDYIGMPCGIMDQMAVGLAAPGKALALNTHNLTYRILPIPEGWTFLTLHSGVRRELADGRYKARFEECQQAAAQLGTQTLCLLDEAQHAAATALPDPLRRRTRHVVSEHQRTLAAIEAMAASDMEGFARLMNESHRSYSEDFEASTPEIDGLVADALALGAKGARLTGGGFGGCLVVLVEVDEQARWAGRFLGRHPAAWQV